MNKSAPGIMSTLHTTLVYIGWHVLSNLLKLLDKYFSLVRTFEAVNLKLWCGNLCESLRSENVNLETKGRNSFDNKKPNKSRKAI